MSESGISSNIIIAKWTDRFLAWLVDFIIISIISTSIIFVFFGTIDFEFEDDNFWIKNIQYFPTSILFLTYWTVLEYKTGQTVGKKILNLKVVNSYGNKPDLKGIMVSSFGKAFLLPFDVVLGLLLTNDKRQRIFNKLGDTIVVKIKDSENNLDVKYIKD